MTKKPKNKPEAYRNKLNKDLKKKKIVHIKKRKKKPIILGKYAWRPLWSRASRPQVLLVTTITRATAPQAHLSDHAVSSA